MAGVEEGFTEKGQEGTLGPDGNILHLDVGCGYTTVYICQNSSN